ncbi:hypothetical protein F4780DRAFT_681974 [Xylariomycetidae sp. FL0641]|nr:hypothetical protein F4780DRAFT_681974 [Xylariomycetidae sp. FL0641]
MPPALELTHSTHAKMAVSNPRLALRRGASYEKVPKSSTTARFNFDHLIYSPPPSPGLPALVPRPRRSSGTPRPSRVLRVLAWVAGLLLLFVAGRTVVQKKGRVPVVTWAFDNQEDYEMIGQYELPDFPTPIAVTDRHGKSKWTVSIPPTYDFPLTAKEYADICAKCHEVAAHVRELHGHSHPSQQAQTNYYYKDPYFLDVGDAEKRGLLPGVAKASLRSRDGPSVGLEESNSAGNGVCKTSLTFVLETTDAGIGPTLMMLWTAYGLAQKENRAFFIDDSRWAYGNYTDIFEAPPVPECNPPPAHEMLPCPHNARHLVVSAATASDTFGNSFNREFENLHKNDIRRERPLYDLARAGYEALFHLNAEDQEYVEQRTKELRAKTRVPIGIHGNYDDGTIVGVHVRHGDLHPYEYQYNGAYIPLNVYAQRGQEVIEDHYNYSRPLGGEDIVAKSQSFMVVASDDPDVYEAEDFLMSFRAQERIKLASKENMEKEDQDRTVMHKFVDETFGWEGGFFATMFWNLGRSTTHNADSAEAADDETTYVPSAETLRLRGLIGRAYMMDLAVLGQGSDTVICTMSAMGCRILAVVMGWEKAIDEGRWINIDGDYQWTGLTI